MRAPRPPQGWAALRVANEKSRAAEPQKTPDRSPRVVRGMYKVVGPKVVLGVKPGDVAELELTEVQESSLIEAGHIVRANDGLKPGKKGS